MQTKRSCHFDGDNLIEWCFPYSFYMLLSLPSKPVFTMAKQIQTLILEFLVRIFLVHRNNFYKSIILKLKQILSYSFPFRHVLQLYMYTIIKH